MLARDPDGYRRLCWAISVAQLAGGEKGRPVYDLERLAGSHDGHWVILTGCRKGAVRAALAAQGPEAAGQELGKLRDAFGRDNVVVELTGHDLPEDDERNDALYELARATGTTAIATGNVHYAAPGGRPAGPGAGRRPGPAQPGRDGRLAGRLRAAPTSDPARRWPTGCAATPAQPSTPHGWPATARSASA